VALVTDDRPFIESVLAACSGFTSFSTHEIRDEFSAGASLPREPRPKQIKQKDDR
jgi:hypothetical protein